MDEREIRTERTTDMRTTGVRSDHDTDRDVDIRRTMIMGRDLGYDGDVHYAAAVPMRRALHWGPIFAGLTTTLVFSLLLGALFTGLGFDSGAGAFGGLTASDVGWGSAIALSLAVFIGSYLTGYVSDLRSKSEGILNGFMVGVMSILTPILLAIFGAYGAAGAAASATEVPPGTDPNAIVPPSVQNQVQNALVVAADNAWTVFLVGMLVLGIATLAGYLGAKSREGALKGMAKKELHEH